MPTATTTANATRTSSSKKNQPGISSLLGEFERTEPRVPGRRAGLTGRVVQHGLRQPLEAGSVHLAGRRARHLVEDDDRLGRRVADPFACETDELEVRRSLASLSQRDVGADVLAVDLVVDPDHACALDARVLEQDAFDLLRADVRAVVDD